MKKLFAFLLILLVVLTFPVIARQQQAVKNDESGAEEAAPPLPPPNPMLKDVNYVRIQSVFNGSLYFKGYRRPTDTEVKEFNLAQTETVLNDAGAGLKKGDIRTLYTLLGDLLKKGGMRIVDLHPEDDKEPTVVPLLTLDIDLTVNTESLRVVLVTLSLSRWVSDWSGTESLQVPAIIWTQRSLFTVEKSASTLSQEIATVINQLIQSLLAEITRANTPPETTRGSS